MKHILTSITLSILCAGLLILASTTAMAQSDQASKAQVVKEGDSPESISCGSGKQFNYSSGLQQFNFCLSDQGNILSLISPAGRKQLSVREGYIACANGITPPYDLGQFSSGWEVATTSQPGGPNTLPLTITRHSLDGKLELKQTFNRDTAQKEISITMILKNISGVSLANVVLARYFDGDIDSTLTVSDANDDIYDDTTDSVSGRDGDTDATHHGLMLTALAFALPHSTIVESFNNFSSHYSGCITSPESAPTAPGDYTGRVQYSLGTLAAGVSKTVTFVYKRY